MSQPHYPSAITGDLVPEDDLMKVSVYRIQTGGHDHFKNEYVGSAHIEDSAIHESYVDAEVLTAFGEPVMVYKEELTYGRAYRMSKMDSDEREMWEQVTEAAIDSGEERHS